MEWAGFEASNGIDKPLGRNMQKGVKSWIISLQPCCIFTAIFCFSLYSRIIISRQRVFVYFKQNKLKKKF